MTHTLALGIYATLATYCGMAIFVLSAQLGQELIALGFLNAIGA